jgi:hypothetical protein
MGTIPALQRILFYSNELLTAEDLSAVDSNNQQLRWLHNRTLHNWGICYGLNVIGSTGATYVTVNPGYANDILGREIILSSPVQQPIPAIPGNSDGTAATYYIVANYVDNADEPVQEQRSATACAPGGAVRLSNAPAINWRTSAQLKTGIDVVLGQVSIRNCVLNANVSAAGRRNATTASNFSIYADQIDAGGLDWSVLTQGATNIGFTTTVDTSAAKFQSSPNYVAQIIGSRNVSNPAVVIVDFVSLVNQSARSFTLQLALPAIAEGVNTSAITDPVNGPQLMSSLNWVVSWMGVEG